MRVHFKTLGCRLNEAESESWAEGFAQGGHHVVADATHADVVIVNSCAVTAQAVRKSRSLLRRIHRDYPQARLVVTGCYATLNAEQAREHLGVDLVVLNADKARLVTLTEQTINLSTVPHATTDSEIPALFRSGRQRAFIKVQDGCRHHCTFCIVTVARGAERSRSISAIVDEINRLCDHQVHEAVLTGVHLGGYGHDLGTHLTRLIEAILTQTQLQRLRLGSLEPWDLPAGFFDLFADTRVMPHLHLPLQSGSDAVLKRMARRCRSADFCDLAARARHQIADVNLTTDIIVGFPGETADDFAQTLALVEDIGFGQVHAFSYSPRSGTAAASLSQQLSEPVKKARSRILHELTQRLRQRTLAQFVGRSSDVLWEGDTRPAALGQTQYFGYTPNYLRVSVQVPDGVQLTNRILPVRLTAICDAGDGLTGELPVTP